MATSAQQSKHAMFRVLVAGFGPFDDHQVNPSYLISQQLPTTYYQHGLPQISFFVHPDPLEVSYNSIATLLPSLVLDSDGDTYDLVLLLGLASRQEYFSIESCARREGYVRKDVRGQIPDADFWLHCTNIPSWLRPSIDLELLHQTWGQERPNEDLQVSDDAGKFLCEFTFFAAMLEYWKRDEKGQRPCMFLHVPAGTEAADLNHGREVVLALVVIILRSSKGRD